MSLYTMKNVALAFSGQQTKNEKNHIKEQVTKKISSSFVGFCFYLRKPSQRFALAMQ